MWLLPNWSVKRTRFPRRLLPALGFTMNYLHNACALAVIGTLATPTVSMAATGLLPAPWTPS